MGSHTRPTVQQYTLNFTPCSPTLDSTGDQHHDTVIKSEGTTSIERARHSLSDTSVRGAPAPGPNRCLLPPAANIQTQGNPFNMYQYTYHDGYGRFHPAPNPAPTAPAPPASRCPPRTPAPPCSPWPRARSRTCSPLLRVRT